MSKRKQGSGRGGGRITQSAQTREILKGDYPAQLKAEMLLAVKGGRQQKRRCVNCGKAAVHADIFITHEVLKVGSTNDTGYLRYWTCDRCHSTGLTDELQAKLLESLR
jgi:hypothetical protein